MINKKYCYPLFIIVHNLYYHIYIYMYKLHMNQNDPNMVVFTKEKIND